MVKFHILLEDGKGWWHTTLGKEPLQFIIDGQKILEPNGTEFRHRCESYIYCMVVRCRELGDGLMTTLRFNDNTGHYEQLDALRRYEQGSTPATVGQNILTW